MFRGPGSQSLHIINGPRAYIDRPPRQQNGRGNTGRGIGPILAKITGSGIWEREICNLIGFITLNAPVDAQTMRDLL